MGMIKSKKNLGKKARDFMFVLLTNPTEIYEGTSSTSLRRMSLTLLLKCMAI